MNRLWRLITLLALLAAPLAHAATPAAAADYLQLEDGSKVLISDLQTKNPGACCIPLKLPFAVSYVSTNKVRLFIAFPKCDDAGLEIKASSLPATARAIEVCASSGSGGQGGKVPIGPKEACAANNNNGLLFQDKTCKAVARPDGSFAYRLLCRKDCDNVYKCLEPTFDYSKCPGVPPQLTYVGLGQKCGFIQDNKQFVCGGNRNPCKDGVCVSGFPTAGGRRRLR